MTGVQTCALPIYRLLNVYSYAGTVPIIIVFVATSLGGALIVDDENSEARAFAADEIPWNELAFKSTHEALRDYLAGKNGGAAS